MNPFPGFSQMSFSDWMNKSWGNAHIIGHYSAINRNELQNTCNNLDAFKGIMLSEKFISNKLYTVWLHLYNIFYLKQIDTENRSVAGSSSG